MKAPKDLVCSKCNTSGKGTFEATAKWNPITQRWAVVELLDDFGEEHYGICDFCNAEVSFTWIDIKPGE